MSCSRPPLRSRRSFLAGALIAAGGLAGCGFEPLYGRTQQGAVSDDLASVRIAPLAERSGQRLHNLLRDRLNPYGQPTQPVYELRLSLAEQLQGTAIRTDETASRGILTFAAGYVLVDLASGQAVIEGQTSASSAFNVLDNRYASTVSADNARDRALVEVAEDLKLRLATYFSSLRS